MLRRKTLRSVLTFALVSVFLLLVGGGIGQAAPPTFDANKVLCNNDFVATAPADAEQIKRVLEAAGSDLKDYRDPENNDKLASEIIAEAINQHPINDGHWINPNLILVKMEAESNTVWGRFNTDLGTQLEVDGEVVGTRADWILFYGWPDDPSGIDPTVKGFTQQISNAVRILSSDFADLLDDGIGRNGWEVGVKNEVDGTTVVPANAATAALYIYTPHIRNDKVNVHSIWTNRIGDTGCDDNVGQPGQRPRPGPAPAATTTLLVLDVSGSMDWAEPTGGRKIDAAKKAANLIIEMIGAENETQGTSHELGVVAFSDSGELLLEHTGDTERVKTAIAGLEPLNGTNMAQGLAVANRQLEGTSPNKRRIVILLSDGVPTVSMSGEQRDIPELQAEVLSGPVSQAAEAGYCLYVVGFGDPSDVGPSGEPSIDEGFLRSLADTTQQANGCGQYYPAKDARQLADVFVELRHTSTGNVIAKFSGNVAQGETTPSKQIPVPASQEELRATVSWPGSQLDLILIDPQGRQVDQNYPGATITPLDTLVYTIINNPVPGNWQASVFGRDVPEGAIDFSTIFSTRPSPPLSWFEIMPFFLMLITGLGTGFFVWINDRTPGGAVPGSAGLRITEGQQAGRFVPFRRDVLTIGRGPNNDIALPDTRSSRNHAQIRREPEGFVLYDQGSMNGTFVNSQQVSRQVLRSGDRIRVGETQLVFEGLAGGPPRVRRARRT